MRSQLFRLEDMVANTPRKVTWNQVTQVGAPTNTSAVCPRHANGEARAPKASKVSAGSRQAR